MNVVSRKERLSVIAATLTNHPNRLYPLSGFTGMFGVAKSTLSEDISIIRDAFHRFKLGNVEVLLGASGGVRYLPDVAEPANEPAVQEVLAKLTAPDRILPGGFIYTADIFLTPGYVESLGRVLWGLFQKSNPDFVLTVETKGIPLAMAVARLFNRPLIVARKGGKLTEGSVLSINYLSGSSKRIQTMSLSKRAAREGQKALIIDDFIAGGGTMRAMCDMMREFSITVVGCGAAIEMRTPGKKRIEHYKSIITLEEVSEEKQVIRVRPTQV